MELVQGVVEQLAGGGVIWCRNTGVAECETKPTKRSSKRRCGRWVWPQRGPGRIYLTGGATALLHDWRMMTVGIDLKLDPEPKGIFEAIARIKDEQDVNIELASPADFVPELPGWRERSDFIATHGQVEFYHYDYCGQALFKIERAHERDLNDVSNMIKDGLVKPATLFQLFGAVVGNLIRYPTIDPVELKRRILAIAGK